MSESMFPRGEPVRLLIALVVRQGHVPVFLLGLLDLRLRPLVDRAVAELNEREAGDRQRREDAGAQASRRFARWAVGVDGAPDLAQAERRGFARRRRVLRSFNGNEFVALRQAGAGMRIEGRLASCLGFERFVLILPSKLMLSSLIVALCKRMTRNRFRASARALLLLPQRVERVRVDQNHAAPACEL